jgi:hypothetical protein
MSLSINPSAPQLQTPLPAQLQQPQQPTATVPEQPTAQPQQLQPGNLLRTALQKLSAGREHDDHKISKAFDKLTHSLEKMFGEAHKVDHEAGEHEQKEGGLKRVGNDLSKLFKGLGMPKPLAKQFSRDLTEAMDSEDVEQVSLSFTSTRSFSLAMQQEQAGYLANGDGSMVAASVSNNFQLTAVQTRSLDVSINLRTGEFSLSRSSFEAFSVSSSSSAALASSGPAEDAADPANSPHAAEAGAQPNASDPAAASAADGSAQPAPPTAAPQAAASDGDIFAMVQQDSTLLQISRTVQQSAIMQLTPATGSETASEEDPFENGIGDLQQLVGQLAELTEATHDLFESLTQISNLRIERDDEDDDDHLRFTLNAQAPIGLTATGTQGRGTTIYPRADGSVGKVVQEPVQITA